MASIAEIENHLEEYLSASQFPDYCVNGLQVEGEGDIRRIVTATSVSERLITTAITRRADAVIVHHGLFWKSTPHPLALTGILGRRVRLLNQQNITLFAYHLPLDAHPVLGNNVMLAKSLGLQNLRMVPVEGMQMPFAVLGNLPNPLSFSDFYTFSDKLFQTSGIGMALAGATISKVFVMAGHGGGYYPDAMRCGADLIFTGSLNEQDTRAIEEVGLNVYATGHYNSEKMGIKALGEHLAKQYNLDAEFIDIPNPV